MNKTNKNWLEWIVFAIGLVMIASAIGYLAYAGATFGEEPPVLEVRLGTPEERGSHFLVPVSVINHGDETAAGVHIEVVMESEGEEKTRGELEIAFVPRRSTRQGWVTFEQDPRSALLKARVLGFERP